jgi:hypothetical protein
MSTKLPIALLVALLVSFGLALPKHGFHHGWGTLSNDWTTQAFGWPCEIWSRTIHSYMGLEKERHYSVLWGHAAGVYAATAICLVGAAVGLGRLRASAHRQPFASPNGGPAERLGNSGVSGGPPSVS